MLRVTSLIIAAAALAGAQEARPRPPQSGVISQVAAGGSWKTVIVLLNPSWQPQDVKVLFRGGDGNLLELPVIVTGGRYDTFGMASEVSRVVEGLAVLRIEIVEDPRSPVAQGWAEVISRGRLIGSARFTQRLSGGRISEAVAPVDYVSRPGLTVAYDNTLGQSTGLAIVNHSPGSNLLEVIIRDENGDQIGTSAFNLPASGHAAFDISRHFGVPTGRGIIEILGPPNGQLSGLGLRFTSAGTFTSVPVLNASQPLPLQP